MYVTKEKLVTVFFIIIAICCVLAVGYLVTGKNPMEEGLSPMDMDTASRYDSNNYNVEYHDNLQNIQAQNGLVNTQFEKVKVLDNSRNPIEYPIMPHSALPVYYQPGSFAFGPSNYVPNYEDSVYLSRTAEFSIHKGI